MIKALRKLGMEGMYLDLIKAIYEKLIANIIIYGKKSETISSKVRSKTRVPTLPNPIQHSPGILAREIKKRRRNKRNTNM
jgi:hypothetical protein